MQNEWALQVGVVGVGTGYSAMCPNQWGTVCEEGKAQPAIQERCSQSSGTYFYILQDEWSGRNPTRPAGLGKASQKLTACQAGPWSGGERTAGAATQERCSRIIATGEMLYMLLDACSNSNPARPAGPGESYFSDS
jgi:hypothetical protein